MCICAGVCGAIKNDLVYNSATLVFLLPGYLSLPYSSSASPYFLLPSTEWVHFCKCPKLGDLKKNALGDRFRPNVLTFEHKLPDDDPGTILYCPTKYAQ